MLRDGEVPEGRAEAAVVQKVAHRVRYGTLEPLQGAPYLVDSVHRHHQRTIRIANQNGGEYQIKCIAVFDNRVRSFNSHPPYHQQFSAAKATMPITMVVIVKLENGDR